MLKTALGAWLACTVLAAALPAAAADAAADFPSRPLRLLAGSPPGGATDTYARLMADALGKVLGQNVVVENRTGASGIVATSAMLNAPADGYTLQITYTPYTLLPSLHKKVPYDTLKDVTGVGTIVNTPLVLVVAAQSPVAGLADLDALSRRRPLNFGSAGVGSGGHLTGEMLKLSRKIPAVHIPYRGAAPAATAVAAGDVDFAFVTPVTARELMLAGKLKPLAVTSPKRSPMLPEIPTMQELGAQDYEFYNWYGILASARTPPAIVDKLNRALSQVLASPEIRKRITADGSEVNDSTPAEFNRFLSKEVEKWSRLVKEIGIQPE